MLFPCSTVLTVSQRSNRELDQGLDFTLLGVYFIYLFFWLAICLRLWVSCQPPDVSSLLTVSPHLKDNPFIPCIQSQTSLCNIKIKCMLFVCLRLCKILSLVLPCLYPPGLPRAHAYCDPSTSLSTSLKDLANSPSSVFPPWGQIQHCLAYLRAELQFYIIQHLPESEHPTARTALCYCAVSL